MELLKTNGGSKNLSKHEFASLLSRFVNEGVQPEEVDLIFPVLDEEREMRIQLDMFLRVMSADTAGWPRSNGT